MLKLGSHVGMSGKKMMLGSVEEALSYGANTFMIYTGAPQNTRRKEISELNIDAAHALMKENSIDEFIIHAHTGAVLLVQCSRSGFTRATARGSAHCSHSG